MKAASAFPDGKTTFSGAACLLRALALAGVLVQVPGVWAQAYPALKPVTLIVPFAAGSGTDQVGRVVAEGLSRVLGQKVVVDNRPGAGGAIGLDAVAKAAPDGYTLAISSTGGLLIPAALAEVDKRPYDVKDFIGIAITNELPLTYVSTAAIPPRNLRDMLAWMKANPTPFVSAGPGTGGHVLGAALVQAAGANGDAVHYKSSSSGIPDLLAGRVFFTVDAPGSFAGLIKEGKLVGLAVLASQRVPLIADVPTIQEAWPDGPEFLRQAALVNFVLAPAKTPREVASRLNAEWARAATDPSIKERFDKAGLIGRAPASLDQVTAYLNNSMTGWNRVVRTTGVLDAVKASVKQ